MKKIIVTAMFACIAVVASAQVLPTVVTFHAKDKVMVTADLYLVADSLPYMVLCHQAGYSRGEYNETAVKFNKLGYNCLAVDLRSGDSVNKVINQTAFLAENKSKKFSYLDAEPDILAAIDYAYEKSNKKKVILVGSSYSASLALKIAVSNDKVESVVAFSPGEYFGPKIKLKDIIKNIDKPCFITSSKDESKAVSELLKGVKSKKVKHFTPAENGVHGSRALWKSTPNHREYWIAMMMFLK